MEWRTLASGPHEGKSCFMPSHRNGRRSLSPTGLAERVVCIDRTPRGMARVVSTRWPIWCESPLWFGPSFRFAFARSHRFTRSCDVGRKRGSVDRRRSPYLLGPCGPSARCELRRSARAVCRRAERRDRGCVLQCSRQSERSQRRGEAGATAVATPPGGVGQTALPALTGGLTGAFAGSWKSGID